MKFKIEYTLLQNSKRCKYIFKIFKSKKEEKSESILNILTQNFNTQIITLKLNFPRKKEYDLYIFSLKFF